MKRNPPQVGQFAVQPGAIDFNKLCWDDYWGLALLPVVGEALAPFKGQDPIAVQTNMCKQAMLKVFWYCWNNNWPCCGEHDRVDSCFQRAELLAAHLFEQDLVASVKPAVVAIIQSFNLPSGGCPDSPVPINPTKPVPPPVRPQRPPTPADSLDRQTRFSMSNILRRSRR